MDADHWIIEHTSLYVFTGILRLCRVAEDTDSERRDSVVRRAVVLVLLHAIEAHRGTRVSRRSDEDMFHSSTPFCNLYKFFTVRSATRCAAAHHRLVARSDAVDVSTLQCADLACLDSAV
jgi:hypothetical protein